jgi:lipid-binding SYLF domain-containing protein
MRMDPRTAVTLVALLATGCSAPTMSERISKSIGNLSDVQASASPVDAEIFREARGIAILDETQAGLVIGGAGGRGLLMRRLDTGWSAPCAIRVEGFSIGVTVGGEGRNVVIVFSTDEAIDKFVADGSYFLAQAQGTFGDAYGRTSDPADRRDQVHVYAVAGGVYGTCALGSIGFKIDHDANVAAYGAGVSEWDILDGKVPAPAGQAALVSRLDRITGPRTAARGKWDRTQPAPEAGAQSRAAAVTEE